MSSGAKRKANADRTGEGISEWVGREDWTGVDCGMESLRQADRERLTCAL